MTDETEPLAGISDESLESMLQRAIRKTAIIGLLASVVLWIAAGWRNAAMMATGTAISAASIYEWRRLALLIPAKMGQKQEPRGAGITVVFFLLRLVVFAGVLYVSLKCFRGSAVALLCGLSLAVLSLVWEALSLLRS
jgi:hypothetical protein